jgi:hypothetical protein
MHIMLIVHFWNTIVMRDRLAFHSIFILRTGVDRTRSASSLNISCNGSMFWRAKLAELFWCVEGDTIAVLLTASDSRYDKGM